VDSLTHMALGAVVGEAIAGKFIGKRGLVLGALAQSIPDIDALAVLWLSPAENLLAHRGITHSLLFAVIATIAFGLLGDRFHRAHKMPVRLWFLFFGSEIAIHLILDSCNAYGIGLFEPFGSLRFSFNTLYVADPLFSLWPFIAMIMLIILSSKSLARRFWIHFGWIICTAYFLFAITNKLQIEKEVKETLAEQKISYHRFLTTPTPLNSLLWFIAVEADSGFHIAHRSTFDRRGKPINFHFFPRRTDLLQHIVDTTELNNLIAFSQGYYTLEQHDEAFVFNDLRFGQIAGWSDPQAKFTFHYYLNNPEENLLVMQRGRFSNWNKKTIGDFLKRIRGD
jgi:inner membrane protein